MVCLLTDISDLVANAGAADQEVHVVDQSSLASFAKAEEQNDTDATDIANLMIIIYQVCIIVMCNLYVLHLLSSTSKGCSDSALLFLGSFLVLSLRTLWNTHQPVQEDGAKDVEDDVGPKNAEIPPSVPVV